MLRPAALRTLLLWAVPVAAVSLGCKGVLGIEDGHLRESADSGNRPCADHCDAGAGGGHSGAGGHDAGSGGARTGGAPSKDARADVDGSAGCNLLRNPPRPEPTSVVNHGGEVEVVGIQSNVDLGDSPPNAVSPPTRWSTIGFDVDERCSFVPDLKENQDCHLPSYAVGVPDGPRGQDNALGKVIQTVRDKLVGSFTSDNYTKAIQAGMSSGIVRLRGYNGEPNDDQVSVANLASASFDSFARAQGAPDGSVSPRWDGNDVWPVASYAVLNENVDAPMYEDNNAYVTNGRLVANFPSFQIRLIVGLSTIQTVDLTLEMHGVVVGCDLEKTKIGRWGWALKNCTLSARVTANELIAQLSHFSNLSDSKPGPLCTDSALYQGFKISICQLVDVATFPGTPHDCDALSFNSNFDTVPGYLGNVFTVEPVAELCDPKSPKTWPSNDRCETLLNADAGGR